MKLVKISDLFDIHYGNSFELINLEECKKDNINAVNFVSRTGKNNGILATFYQSQPYYTGFHVLVLHPKKIYSELEMIFYCYCIRKNKYRYNYGRQANKTLKDILIPEEMLNGRRDLEIKKLNTLREQPILGEEVLLNTNSRKWFNVNELFNISASRDSLSEDLTEGGKTPYITSSETNNGVTSFFEEEATNKAGTITANRGGSVGYFFYQPMDYMATPVDVRILSPKFQIDSFIGLFIKTVLQLEKYRYNYSRKMGTDRLNEFKIKLPATLDNNPDWDFMRNYIKSLPYSSSL